MAGLGLYSRVVAVLKVGLPLVALGLLSAVFLVQTEDNIGGGLTFSPGDIEALGKGLHIANPTFTGTTSGDDSFRFSASEVIPDAAPPTRATITDLTGQIDLHDGPVVSVDSESGDLYLPSQRLDLSGNVLIETSDGYRIRAPRATLDLRNGALVAADKVATTGPLGRIDSGSLHVVPASLEGESYRFSFDDGVRLLYDPPGP